MDSGAEINPVWLKNELDQPGRSQSALQRYMGFSSPAIVNRMCQGTRDISAKEADKIREYLKITARHRGAAGFSDETPEQPEADLHLDYVEVDVLPTYAGLGGGGTGEGDVRRALVARQTMSELRMGAEDALIIDVRGDSMIDPATGKGFAHGDQLLINRRDINPRQPGPFALWYDDGYVVKNVEIIRKTGKLRIFSNNPVYSEDEVNPQEVRIMGRPVWYARRL